MKRELALRLLQTSLPGLDDGTAAALFRELEFLADYKYNKYEMYHPGRLFLENLYLWFQQFEENERTAALNFVRKELIFISRQEFQQLAGVLYHNAIKRRQLEVAAKIGGRLRHKIRAISESPEFKDVTRASLYVGMSDGARIDYIRRHNLDISNEQVLPYYETSEEKAQDLLRELRAAIPNNSAKFRFLFLIDDFCGSGRTLLREVVTSKLDSGTEPPAIPTPWRSRLGFNQNTHELELLYTGELSVADQETIRRMGTGEAYASAVDTLLEKSRTHTTILKGALQRVATRNLVEVIDPNANIYFCPLLVSQHALTRLEPLLGRLPGPFSRIQILPGVVIDSGVAIRSDATPIGELCEKYYTDDLGDEHTGDVKFGFDGCGLPLVLHHNTPNNSIYLLWARRSKKLSPLFVRYERHGREGA